MRYPQFRARGLCISSGVVEGPGCKQIGDRLKTVWNDRLAIVSSS